MGRDVWMGERWVMIMVTVHVICTWIVKLSTDSNGMIRFGGGECGLAVRVWANIHS